MLVMISEDRGDYDEISFVEVCGPERLYEAVEAQVRAAHQVWQQEMDYRRYAEREHDERSRAYWVDGKSDDLGDYERYMADLDRRVRCARISEARAKVKYDELYDEFAGMIPPLGDVELVDLDSIPF